VNDSVKKPYYLGHRERLRQKLLNAGGQSFSDCDLLEYLLMQAIPRRDVKPLAKELLERFSSFAGVLSADKKDLAQVSGIKDASAALFAVVREASLRLGQNEINDRPVLNNWDAVIRYSRMKLGRQKVESFAVLFLDVKNMPLSFDVLQTGTVDQATVYPREVVKRCLSLEAGAVVLIHNHPTGDVAPSRADVSLTKTMEDALKPLNIRLLDHLIVSKSGHFSFKAMKYI